MPRCIAYTRSPLSRNAWNPCKRKAVPGSRFCRQHDDAVDGAILGLVLQSVANAMKKNRAATSAPEVWLRRENREAP